MGALRVLHAVAGTADMFRFVTGQVVWAFMISSIIRGLKVVLTFQVYVCIIIIMGSSNTISGRRGICHKIVTVL